MLWCSGANTWCLVTLTAESHNPFSFSDCKKSNQCCLPLHPSLFLPRLHLPWPPALVKANMLETSPELSRRLEARLRIAKVRALVSLQQCEFNVCYPADWACYSAVWLERWWRDVLTYQDTGDLNVRKQKFLLDKVGMFVWVQVVAPPISFAYLYLRMTEWINTGEYAALQARLIVSILNIRSH